MGISFEITPFAEHVADAGPDDDHKSPGTVEPGAGQLELGFYVGDNRIVFASLKAGAYTDLFKDGDPTTGEPAEGVASSESSASSSEPAADDRYAELEQRIAELESAKPADGEQQPPGQ